MKFAPLHIYSGYSFLKSGLTIEKIIQSVKANDYYGAGLADINVLYGVPEFFLAMEEIKKPSIIGIEINVNGFLLNLYAINEEGYLNLSYISSKIEMNNFTENNLKEHSHGIIAILNTHDEKAAQIFASSINEESRRYINNLLKYFDDFYLGVELEEKNELPQLKRVREFANEYNYKTVAFPKIKYQKKKDAIVLSIVEAISNNQTLDIKEQEGNECFFKEEDYFKIYTKEEIDNTISIVSRSHFDYHKKRGEMLHYPCEDSKVYLEKLVFESLKSKGLDTNNDYINRAKYELSVITSMGYCDYFLIVQDYVTFAKDSNILVGPGRGSAAGSLVSYLLSITEIDPLKYGLQFERFLNPSRKTMPDIDIDFMDTRRDEVVEYCRRKYGENKVANIVTFQTILAKQALRDIGRIYDYPTRHIDLLSKRLTNFKLSLRESYKKLPAFRELVDSDKYFLEIVALASKIEGLPRQSGVHAAGIILNNTPIEEAMPVSMDLSDNYISQYEMKYLEEQGFLKMDFLGLRNLSIISRCVDLINMHYPNVHLDKKHVPYDDPKVYELIASCRTMGLFQLESSGMKRAIRVLKPSCFEDVVALLALFRPGPMDSIPTYARRKEGKEKFTYISKGLESILSSTYGIIVYQEQINQIATVMAGFTPGEADTFRRAVSKKKVDVLASQEKAFIDGAMKNGYSYKISKDVFDHILKFANYGFNKSHSVGYSLIACQMGWLKVFYPLEFYAAILENSSATNDVKFGEYISEMKSQNINILAPDINHSTNQFIVYNKGLLFPLSAIKGINDTTVEKIISEREKGEFVDFFDFITRMYPYNLSEVQINRLIDSGCLDKFSNSRQMMRMSIESGFQFAQLFGGMDGQISLGLNIPKPNLIQANDDPLENLDKEYQALGIMLSSNPLHYKKDLLVAKHVIPIADALNNREFTVAGIVKTKKTINTKKGTAMAFIKIFDETGEMEITIFPNLYTKCIGITDKNNIIVARCKRDINKNEVNYLAEEINLLEE